MTGVLIVAHGSRAGETEQTMRAVREMVQRELEMDAIVEAYMEFRPVNIEAGLLQLMEQGATDIKVIPYFLFDGIHIKQDIPQEIAAFCEKHPQIQVTMGKTLGADARLAAVVVDRIREML